MKFRVSGFAMIPIEVQMVVEAPTEYLAKRAALDLFNHPNCSRRDFIVGGSEDESAVHAWEPLEAKPL